MLDKTDKTDKDEVTLRSVDGAAPAIFVRINTQISQSRTMEVSFGIPLDMKPSDLNQYLDKVAACADRQRDLGYLQERKLALEGYYRDLATNMQNQNTYQTKQEADWYSRGKMGVWKPNGSETAQLNGFNTTDKNIRENLIPRLEKEIAELEEKTK